MATYFCNVKADALVETLSGQLAKVESKGMAQDWHKCW